MMRLILSTEGHGCGFSRCPACCVVQYVQERGLPIGDHPAEGLQGFSRDDGIRWMMERLGPLPKERERDAGTRAVPQMDKEGRAKFVLMRRLDARPTGAGQSLKAHKFAVTTISHAWHLGESWTLEKG